VQKTIAPLSARNELKDNIRREDSNIKNSGIQDKAQAHKEKDKWQKTMDHSCPETLSPQARNEMWKRAKLLKDQFTIGMLSTDELHPVKTFERAGVVSVFVDREKMQSTNAVERQRAWNDKMGAKVKEYKNIMRHLNPDNPAATDVEKFRAHKRLG